MSAATIAFAVCSIAATVIFLLAYRGALNVYYYGGNPDVKPEWRKPLWILTIASFVVGCLLTAI